MKAYIIYIATLLAALALPANGQNNNGTTKSGGIDTKAAPDVPAMPYRLSMTLTGSAHGKVSIATTKPSDDKGLYYPLTADSLVYGAPNSNYTPGKNAAEVKISVVPDPFYELRDGYPKVYPTGKPTETLPTSGDDDANGNPYRTFRMPASPVTVEMAYAIPVDSLIPISLKDTAADITAALAQLPKYVPIRLIDGRKDSLKVDDTKGWVLNESSFNGKPGVVNEFKVRFSLPDSLYEASSFKAVDGVEGMFWEYIKVTNKAESLKPEDAKDKEIVISGGTGGNLNGNTGTDGTDQAFNGTIEDADVKSLEIGGDVKDATLTLKDVTVSGGDDATKAKTEVKSGADLTIKVEGKSELGTLTVEEGAAVVLTKSEGATLKVTEVANAGSFRDSTATITTVTGPGALAINATLTGGSTVTPNTKVTLTASTNDKAGTTTFIWQQLNADGSYTEVSRQAYDADGKPAVLTKADTAPTGIVDTYEPATASTGTVKYRCLIERTTPAGDSGEKPATTLLSTQPASVVVKSGGDPVVPPSTYYTVTLPALEGFTSTPAAGKHSVEEGNSFSFSLTPKAGNTESAPVVTTSRGETIKPRPADGKYVITGIYEDITISFASTPTANEAFGPEGIRISSSAGQLHIQTPQPAAVTVYTLAGHSLRRLDVSAGDSRIELPAGFYIVSAGSLTQKVIIR